MKKIYTLTVFELNECELVTQVFNSYEKAFQGINELGILDQEVKNQKELDKILDQYSEEGNSVWIEIQEHEINF